MGTIAKGEITLSPVNDAYTVLLTPSSCSISADFDGSNPNLTNAKGTITVKRGTKIVPFKIDRVSYSDSGIKISWVQQEVTVMPFIVTHIPFQEGSAHRPRSGAVCRAFQGVHGRL